MIGAPAQERQTMTDYTKDDRKLSIVERLIGNSNFETNYIYANSEGTYSFDFRHIEEGTMFKFLDTIDPQATFEYYNLSVSEDVILIIDTEQLPANEVENICVECGMPTDPITAAVILNALLYHEGEIYFPEDLDGDHAD
jgi:hypothetical protein